MRQSSPSRGRASNKTDIAIGCCGRIAGSQSGIRMIALTPIRRRETGDETFVETGRSYNVSGATISQLVSGDFMEPTVEATSHHDTADNKTPQEIKIDLERCTTVLVCDADEPWAHLALLRLQAVPRPGDLIKILVAQKMVTYSVSYVNFDPYEPRCHVTLGCKFIPLSSGAPNNSGTTIDLKDRMEQLTKSNLQIFEKAQAYTNAILVAGYAGIFGLWTFAKPAMTPRATNWTVILAGASLLCFITWEILQMIWRAVAAEKFAKLVDKSPNQFFELLTGQEADNRRVTARNQAIWKAVLLPTVGLAYAAALILIYNAAAGIFGFPQWP